DRVAIVGDADLIRPMRVLGMRVFAPKDAEEAKAVLRTLEEENIALCFLHQSLLELLREERAKLAQKVTPVVVGYSDYREVFDRLEDMLKEMAVKATGSDALVKRRGTHGSR
ncbi:MAG: V-type ATP synthase subunit F, partial [Candidatus Aminicenantales bacterium]